MFNIVSGVDFRREKLYRNIFFLFADCGKNGNIVKTLKTFELYCTAALWRSARCRGHSHTMGFTGVCRGIGGRFLRFRLFYPVGIVLSV